MNATVERLPSPIVEVRHQLNAMEDQFKAALPAHMPAERFMRVVMTAVQNNPDLLQVTRRSLWNSAMKAAQDGLLPDGREGAIVPYKGEATWMPMVGGLRKKVRNSGEIATWDVHAVYENDEFEFALGDEPHILHRPSLGDRGKLIAVYSIATLKSGEKSRDVMSVFEVEKIKAKSRAKNGPWADPTFYPEMAKKTVARRHSKVLPMSTDLDDLIRRDDELYDMKGARDEADAKAVAGGRPKSLGARLDLLASMPDQPDAAEGGEGDVGAPSTMAAPSPDGDGPEVPETGEPTDAPGAAATDQDEPLHIQAGGDKLNAAYRLGREAHMTGMARKATPPDLRAAGREDELGAWVRGWDASAAVDADD